MSASGLASLMLVLGTLDTPEASASQGRNGVLGTWRMMSAKGGAEGRSAPLYGARPTGLLVFTSDLHCVEVLTDADTPAFASDARGGGTAEENKAARAGRAGGWRAGRAARLTRPGPAIGALPRR